MNTSLILEQLINGLVAGSMYALMGGGIAMVYGTMKVMNFAHGEFFMLGGYLMYAMLEHFQMPTMVAIIVPIACVPLIAMAFNALMFAPLVKRDNWEMGTIVTALGLSIALQAIVQRTVGAEYLTVPYLFDGSVRVGDFQLPGQRVAILVVALIAIGLMELFLGKTRPGWALRATSQDAQAASVVGISTRAIFLLAFGLSGLLAAIAVVLLAPIQSVNPWMGASLALKAFVVVILGGMGSFRGTILAGFLLGLVEAVGVMLTSSEWSELFFFGLLIAVLWFKPEGIFGARRRKA
jgi:branched-chain amino acid transport system permease protein